MSPIRGVVEVEVAGEQRTLACDMRAADALFTSLGPHWLLWLYERLPGKPTKMPDGATRYEAKPLSPHEAMVALYGMLASDRARSGREETVETLMASVSPHTLGEIQQALMRTVIASMGVPGEGKGADAGAAAVPPGSERAITPGIGRRS